MRTVPAVLSAGPVSSASWAASSVWPLSARMSMASITSGVPAQALTSRMSRPAAAAAVNMPAIESAALPAKNPPSSAPAIDTAMANASARRRAVAGLAQPSSGDHLHVRWDAADALRVEHPDRAVLQPHTGGQPKDVRLRRRRHHRPARRT